MQVLQILSAPTFILSFLFFFYLFIKSLKAWREVKEEVFIHLAFLILAISLIIIVFYIGIFFITFPGLINKSALFYMGILYDLFYLELSFFYLTLFSNSKKFYEKYIPIVITIAFLLNFVAGYSQIEPYIEFAIFFHAIVIVLGLFLIYRTFNHFKISIFYSRDKNEIELLNFLSKIMIFILLTFIIDGLGFLAIHYWVKFGFMIDEWLIIYLNIVFIGILIFTYFVVMKIKAKTKNIDLLQFMNNLS